MKYYHVRWAFTRGILEFEADDPGAHKFVSQRSTYGISGRLGVDVFKDLRAAKARVEEMRKAQIRNLERKVEKLKTQQVAVVPYEGWSPPC